MSPKKLGSPLVSQKVMDVAASSLDLARTADNWQRAIYHLGSAMGVLAHLMYDELGIQTHEDPNLRDQFMRGFDHGMETAKGVVEVVSDPRLEGPISEPAADAESA